MKKLFLFLFAASLWAQNPQQGVVYVDTDPTGQACLSTFAEVVKTTGSIYTCKLGVWAIASGGGGGGATIAATTAVIKGDNAGNGIAAVAGTDYVGGQATLTGTGVLPLVSSTGILGPSTVTDNGTNVQVGRTLAPSSAAAFDLGIATTNTWKNAFFSGQLNIATISASGNITTSGRFATGNCASSASPAVCGTNSAGGIVIAVAATTVQVNTTAVTSGNQILVTADNSLGTKLGVTCNTTSIPAFMVTARTSGSNFTITVAAAPITNPYCFSYLIIN